MKEKIKAVEYLHSIDGALHYGVSQTNPVSISHDGDLGHLKLTMRILKNISRKEYESIKRKQDA